MDGNEETEDDGGGLGSETGVVTREEGDGEGLWRGPGDRSRSWADRGRQGLVESPGDWRPRSGEGHGRTEGPGCTSDGCVGGVAYDGKTGKESPTGSTVEEDLQVGLRRRPSSKKRLEGHREDLEE